jgi:RimJ/RimL family protein N-acetyltransferase
MRWPTPTLETERLRLEPLTVAHAESYARHFVDYEVIQHLSDAVPWPYPDGGVRDYIEAVAMKGQGESRWDWALTLREAPGEAIGSVGLWRPGAPENRGFWLGRAFWGRGLMTEALEPIMGWAFDEAGFEQVILSNAVGNTRSRRLKERAGATLLGVEPTAFVRPDYTESERWLLTRQAWESRAGAEST